MATVVKRKPSAKKLADLGAQLAEAIIETAIRDGHLKQEENDGRPYTDAQIKYLRSFAKSKRPIHFVTDHRDSLLERARDFRRKKDPEEAILFYATWTEHMLNLLFASSLRRKKLIEPQIRECIFGTSIRAKYILIVLEFSKKSSSELWSNRIKKLCDLRNQFVHFKWNYQKEEASDQLERAYKSSLLDAEKIVTHLVSLDRKYINSYRANSRQA